MIGETHTFEDVTLLVTHYNRSKSLERLLASFEALNCNFHEIIVSDDGSKPEQLAALELLRDRYNFNLVTTPKNKGLGNNINKGQDSVKSPFTLYIQEDFTPKPDFIAHFKDAYRIMKEDSKWDLISLYAYEKYPYTKPYQLGFSERIFKSAPWYTNNLKFYLYSDHPHLRRSSFFEKFGRYREGINGDRTEMSMSMSFIKNHGKSLMYDDHYGLLTQENSEDEPSTANFRNTIDNNGSYLISIAKWAYAKFKFTKLNLQLVFHDKK